MTITAKIIADSITPDNARITTFELEYPRFIHSEFMTHRLFSRNAASSRAIPVKRAIELIVADTAMPIHWGKNRPGMSAKEECTALINVPASFSEFVGRDEEGWAHATHGIGRESAWNLGRNAAIAIAEAFDEAGYHKQIVNRLLEPFTHIKVVLTATELDNWFWLRNHIDAQPEIHELCNQTLIALDASTPKLLFPGSWHLPYFQDGDWNAQRYNQQVYGADLDKAIAVSASCCAQVSYRRMDDSVEKAEDIYKRLIESMPPHFSPFEHQATPMDMTGFEQEGVTHMDRSGKYWSGNFCGWIQHRQVAMNTLGLQPMISVPTIKEKQ